MGVKQKRMKKEYGKFFIHAIGIKTLMILCLQIILTSNLSAENNIYIKGGNFSTRGTETYETTINPSMAHLNFQKFSDQTISPFLNPNSPYEQMLYDYDDDFGDEELGVIPVSDMYWGLILLCFVYAFFKRKSTLAEK